MLQLHWSSLYIYPSSPFFLRGNHLCELSDYYSCESFHIIIHKYVCLCKSTQYIFFKLLLVDCYCTFSETYFDRFIATNTFCSISFILIAWFFYLFARQGYSVGISDKAHEQIPHMFAPQMPSMALGQAGDKAGSWVLSQGLPSGWQWPSYLSHQYCLPGSTLAESWCQEPEPVLNPDKQYRAQVLTSSLNCQTTCPSHLIGLILIVLMFYMPQFFPFFHW